MIEEDRNLIKFQLKYSQHCRSCSKLISLHEKITFLCTKCKMYFCVECATFLNENPSNKTNNCPGGNNDPHDSIMVKITRNLKEYKPIGISIDVLEQKKTIIRDTIKIIESETKESNAKKKTGIKILED